MLSKYFHFAGKTTLMNVLCGIADSYGTASGTLLFNGVSTRIEVISTHVGSDSRGTTARMTSGDTLHVWQQARSWC